MHIYGRKTSFLARFRVSGPKNRKTGFFGKNRAMSLFSPYSGLTSCKESEKSLEPFSRKRSKSLKNLVFGPFSGLRDRKPENRVFREQTAVHVSCPHSDELPCIISKKSLEPFLRKLVDYQPTNYQPTTRVILWDLLAQAQVQNDMYI